MRAPGRNAAKILSGVLLSVAAMSLSLLSFGRFDLITSASFGSATVLSEAASMLAAAIIMRELMRVRVVPRPQYVRVRI